MLLFKNQEIICHTGRKYKNRLLQLKGLGLLEEVLFSSFPKKCVVLSPLPH